MRSKNLFSIGELSKICNLPISTLRHYDKVGVLKPVYVDPASGYRYYDEDSIVKITLLSVYKYYGFSLDAVKSLLSKTDLKDLQASLEEKIHDLNRQLQSLGMTKTFFSDWVELLKEAQNILAGKDPGLSLRYISYPGMLYHKPEILPFMKLKHLLVHTNICHKKDSLVFTRGPLFLKYPSADARLTEDLSQVEYYIACNSQDPAYEKTVVLGNCSAITAYHKGSYKTIGMTYEKIFRWAEEHRFELRGDCLERYVTDYWSSDNEELFVTEVMLPLK